MMRAVLHDVDRRVDDLELRRLRQRLHPGTRSSGSRAGRTSCPSAARREKTRSRNCVPGGRRRAVDDDVLQTRVGGLLGQRGDGFEPGSAHGQRALVLLRELDHRVGVGLGRRVDERALRSGRLECRGHLGGVLGHEHEREVGRGHDCADDLGEASCVAAAAHARRSRSAGPCCTRSKSSATAAATHRVDRRRRGRLRSTVTPIARRVHERLLVAEQHRLLADGEGAVADADASRRSSGGPMPRTAPPSPRPRRAGTTRARPVRPRASSRTRGTWGCHSRRSWSWVAA